MSALLGIVEALFFQGRLPAGVGPPAVTFRATPQLEQTIVTDHSALDSRLCNLILPRNRVRNVVSYPFALPSSSIHSCTTWLQPIPAHLYYNSSPFLVCKLQCSVKCWTPPTPTMCDMLCFSLLLFHILQGRWNCTSVSACSPTSFHPSLTATISPQLCLSAG